MVYALEELDDLIFWEAMNTELFFSWINHGGLRNCARPAAIQRVRKRKIWGLKECLGPLMMTEMGRDGVSQGWYSKYFSNNQYGMGSDQSELAQPVIMGQLKTPVIVWLALPNWII